MKRRHQNRKRTARKRRGVRRATRTKLLAPRTAKRFFGMPTDSQDTWNRAVHVISEMRKDGISLRQASQKFRISPRIVARLGRSALRKRANGRYEARPNDRLLRVVAVPTDKGLREVALRSSHQASQVGEYWAAVQRYFETGDASRLNKFEGKHITDANGKRIPFLTNLEELDRLGSAGVLSFESLYAGVA